MSFLRFFLDMLKGHKLIFELTKNDFSSKYLGSYLGIFWAFVHPALTILIFWFVFQVGFRTTPIENYPYVLWLVSGIIPWFFFSESFGAGTHSIVENSYLVKKVVFRVSILPIIKISSTFVIHSFFILAMFIISACYGYYPTLYSLQIIYYLIAMIMLLLGLTWLTSSIFVYLKDVSQIVGIITQFGFWLTPIFWNFKSISSEYVTLFKLNPMVYIVEGYRNCFIYKKWFWEDVSGTIVFWVITIFLLLIGVIMFKRLRPHFSDVI